MSKSLREFECLYPFNMTESGIYEYNIYDMLNYLGCFNDNMSFDDGCSVFLEFCNENNITYYASPRESFYVQDGYEKCRREGNYKVVMEDLS